MKVWVIYYNYGYDGMSEPNRAFKSRAKAEQSVKNDKNQFDVEMIEVEVLDMPEEPSE